MRAFMKLTTLIKAYKLALASVDDKVANWDTMYVGDIVLPNESSDKLVFVFSTSYDMKQGSMGLSTTINCDLVEKMSGGLKTIAEMTMNVLDRDMLAREYIAHGEKINEAGRVLVLLETLLQRLKDLNDSQEEFEIKDLYFNFDEDSISCVVDDRNVYTDGNLVLFG
jgi:hypothetical protein